MRRQLNTKLGLERGKQSLAGGSARERMLAGLPVAGRRLQVADTSTAVLEGGGGRPLIVLHGGIECGGAYWAPVISRLAQGYRLIVPDAPGLGESDPVARLDAETFARWLRELIRLTCDERPTLVAHSLLGTLAARFAAAHTDSLARLIIYAAPGVGTYRMPLGLRIVAIRFALRPTERNEERFERFALLDRERTRRRDPVWFDSFSAYALSRAQVRHVKRTMGGLIKSGTKRVPDAQLGRIEVPAALLWGRHDRMTPLPVAEVASARLGWPLHVVDDAAHVPHIEQPEGFVVALADALGEELTAGASETEAVQ
ncbi:MAG TPA: alpha/beta hydrolase [Solirubrobacterales bacterium]|nr:alpha/beta hydrolase [Solirubrobacterales bacterium]